jgi:hypothetical protein
VDEALEALESDLGQRAEALRATEAELEHTTLDALDLRSRLARGERETAGLRAELAASRERTDAALADLAVVGRQLDELRSGARGQATRIRLSALREAAELTARLSDLATEEGSARRDRLLDALEQAIDRVASEWEDAPRPPAAVMRRRAAVNGTANGNGRAPRRSVSVDVGPFADFSQLVRFEDAANAIGATGDISIKRFSEGRARIDVALSEPVDLLKELEERCDLEFQVRSNKDDEIVLDVD